MKRFFISDLANHSAGALIDLPDGEAHHLRTVLRGAKDDAVELFDGQGRCSSGVVAEVTRKSVTVQMTGPIVLEPVAQPQLVLAMAAPKADRLRWLVEKSVELGVDALIPLVTERSVTLPGEGKLAKVEEAALQACKQCGRNRLLRVASPTNWQAFWEQPQWPSDPGPATVLLADRDGQSLGAWRSKSTTTSLGTIIVVIGPEGGLTPRELQQAIAKGAIPVSLGRHILRVETAALAAAAILRG